MHVLAYVLGFTLLVAGILGVVLPVIPGSLLLVAGTVLVGWANGFVGVGWGTIAFSVVIAAMVWSVDLVAAALGTKLAKASRWAVLGAGIGLLVGLFFGPIGIILGPAVGAVAFEYARNPDARHALRAGAGAFLGFVLGSVVKITLSMILLGIVVWRALV